MKGAFLAGFFALMLIIGAANGASLREKRAVTIGENTGDAQGSVSENANGGGDGQVVVTSNQVEANSEVTGQKTNDNTETTAGARTAAELKTDGVVDTDGEDTVLGSSIGSLSQFLSMRAERLNTKDAGRGSGIGAVGSTGIGASLATLQSSSRTLGKLKNMVALGFGLAGGDGNLGSDSTVQGSSVSDQDNGRTETSASGRAVGESEAAHETVAQGAAGEFGQDPTKSSSASTNTVVGNGNNGGSAGTVGQSLAIADTDAGSLGQGLAVGLSTNTDTGTIGAESLVNAETNDQTVTSGVQSGSIGDSGSADVVVINAGFTDENQASGLARLDQTVRANNFESGYEADLKVSDPNGDTTQVHEGYATGQGNNGAEHTISVEHSRAPDGTGSGTVSLVGQTSGSGSSNIQHGGTHSFINPSKNEQTMILLEGTAEGEGDDTSGAVQATGSASNEKAEGESTANAAAGGNDAAQISFATGAASTNGGRDGGAQADGSGTATAAGGQVALVGSAISDTPGPEGNSGQAIVVASAQSSTGPMEFTIQGHVIEQNDNVRRRKRSLPQMKGFRIRSMEHNNRKFWLTEEVDLETGKSVLRPLTLMGLLKSFDLRVALPDAQFAGTEQSILENAVLYSVEPTEQPRKIKHFKMVHPIQHLG